MLADDHNLVAQSILKRSSGLGIFSDKLGDSGVKNNVTSALNGLAIEGHYKARSGV